MKVSVEAVPEDSVCELVDKKRDPLWIKVVAAVAILLIVVGAAFGMLKAMQWFVKWDNANYKTDMLQSMNSSPNDVAANFVIDSYRAVCAKEYMSQACATAVANNVKVSSLSADQKARARQIIAQYSGVSIQLLP